MLREQRCWWSSVLRLGRRKNEYSQCSQTRFHSPVFMIRNLTSRSRRVMGVRTMEVKTQQRAQQPFVMGSATVGRLILVRHGQSIWNVTDPSRNLTARFTGWTDVPLTDLGRAQAVAAGRAMASKISGITHIDCAACSLLGRARETLHLILDELGLVDSTADERKFDVVSGASGDGFVEAGSYKIPVISSWRLNERHYGALVGLSKSGAEEIYNVDELLRWRNGWETRPPPMNESSRMEWSTKPHCQTMTIVRDPTTTNGTVRRRMGQVRIIEKGDCQWLKSPFASVSSPSAQPRMPASESLRDAFHRVLPLWNLGLAPRLAKGQTILVVSHANTIKSILKTIDPGIVRTQEDFRALKVPSAVPLVYHFAARGDKTDDISEWGGFEGDAAIAVPGGLEVLPQRMAAYNDRESEEAAEKKEGLRYRLHGKWIESDEVQDLSFCSNVSEANVSYEIA